MQRFYFSQTCTSLLALTTTFFMVGCGGSSSDAIDGFLGGNGAPILTSIANQTIPQDNLLTVDVNNIKKGSPGDDSGMSYSCTFDTILDGSVNGGQDCSAIPVSTVTFDPASGILHWTPNSPLLGNWELKITGTNDKGQAYIVFTVGVRLKFDGISSLSQITGTGVTVNWVPNTSATGYEIFKFDPVTGQYSLMQTVAGGATSGYALINLIPNTGYTLKVNAVDSLGNLDGNVNIKSFTTTSLTKLAVTPPTATVAAGASLPMTVQAYDSNGAAETVGGLTITPQVLSGSSVGSFSAVNDNGDGTYSFTYNPTTVGTPVTIGASMTSSFFLLSSTVVTVVPGPASSSNSTLLLSANPVVSGSSATITATIKDAFNNPVDTGITVGFSAIGGTSTGVISAVTNAGAGVYTATYTGLHAGTAQTLKVAVDGTYLTPTRPVQVVPGTADSTTSTISISAGTVSSGNSVTVTAVLKDANSNVIPSGVTLSFNKAGGTSTGNFGTITNVGGGTYTTTYTGALAGTAQTLTLAVDGVTLIPSTTITVVPGAVSLANSNLSITSSTVSSGNFVTATATLRDGSNNTLSSGIVVTFSATGGTSTGSFNTVTNQGNGVYSIRYTGIVAGTSQNVDVLINGVDLGLSVPIQVIPSSPDATKSTISVSSSTVVSSNSVTITATLRDLNNNLLSSGYTVGFSATGGTSSGILSSITNVGSGVYTATYTGITAGTAQTLNILVNTSPLGPTTTIRVLTGAYSAANSTLTTSNASVVSGNAVTLIATLLDINNNPISGTIVFTKTGGTSTGTLGPVVNQGNGVYTATYTGVAVGTAQTIGVTIDGADAGLSTSQTVTAAAPNATESTITVSSATVLSNNSVTITATLKDLNDNLLSTGYTVTFSATGGTSTGTISATTNAGNGVYTATYTGVAAGTAQTLNILVNSTGLRPTTTIRVMSGTYSSSNSSLTTTNGTVVSSNAVTLTATLLDINNNPIGGTIAFAKTGGTSTGTFGTLVNQGNGVYTTTYTGVAAGTAQTIGVTINGTDAGLSANEIVVPNVPNATNSTITVSSPTVVSGNAVTVTAAVLDLNNNPISSGVTVGITATGGTSSGTLSGVTNVGNGNYTATYTGVSAGSAQTLNITIGAANLGPTTTITVNSGSLYTLNSSLTTTNASVTSGTTVTLTATLRDTNNNPVTGTVAFTKTGGTSTGTFGTMVNQGGGVYTMAYSGVTAGTAQTMGITINGTDSGLSLTETVVPAAPSITNSNITVSAGTIVSGAAATVTATIKDLNNNPIGSGITVTFAALGGSSTGTIGSVTNVGNGVYTTTYTGVNAGSAQTLNIVINGTTFGPTTTITVSSGTLYLANSSLTTTNASVVSGSLVTITATLRDVNNNPVSGTIAFTKTGGTSTGTFGSMVNQGGGVYTITYTAVTAGSAQTIGVTIGGVDSGMNVSETVTAGAPSSSLSTITVGAASIVSGTSTTVTATILDSNSNPISSGITVAITATGGTSTGNLGTLTNAGSGKYTVSYTGVTAGTAQTLNITVGGANLGPTTTVTVTPGSLYLANSSITTSNGTVVSGSLVTITATLLDSNSNPVTGTIAFTKTGGTSTGTFGSVVNQGGGVYTVTYSGLVAGTAQTIGVTIGGTASGLTVSQTVTAGTPSSSLSTISVSAGTIVSGNSATITATIRDANSNPISTGITVGVTATGGSSTGNLSAITNAGSGVYTATYTGVTAGSAQTLNITIGGSNLGPTTTITVNAGSLYLANSSLVTSAATLTSASTVTITATLRDSNSNPVAGAIAFTKTGGTSSGTFGTAVNQGGGVYTVTYTGVAAGTAQTIGVTIATVDSGMNVTETVSAGAPDPTKSTISAASSSVVSGSTDTVTATILDSNSNPITSGITVTFSKTGGSSTGSFSAVTNQGSGQYAVNYQGVAAGTAQTIGVLINGSALGPSTTITVIPGTPSSSLSTLTLSSATVVSGATVTITASVVDSTGNPISTGIVVTFGATGGSSTGNMSSITNQGNGIYTATYTGVTAGTAQTIQTQVNGSGFGPTQSLQVLVGTPNAANSSLSIVTSPVASGGTATISALIRDSNNNPITTQYTITFDTIGGTSSGTIGSITNGGGGSFSAIYTGSIAGTANTVRVLANSSPIAGLTGTIQVVPGALSAGNSTFTIGSSVVQAGTSTNLSLNLRDANNNAIASGVTVTFNKSTGVSDGTIGSVTNSGNGNYSASYTAVTQGAAQTITLVLGGVATTMSVTATVTAGPPTKMSITGPANPLNSIDCNGPYVVTLLDASNNVTFSTGSVAITLSSSPLGSESGTLFSEATCTSGISSLSLAASVSTVSFWYKSYVPKTFTMTLTPNPSSIATNTVSLTNNPVISWIGSAISATMAGTGITTVADDTSGGLATPTDVLVDGNFLYVADNSAYRILKYNISTNTLIGWIGHVGLSEGMAAYDASNSCTGLAAGALTPVWCTGGRSNPTNSAIISQPKYMAQDTTYLYISTPANNRIIRIAKADGSYQGWIGRIGSVVGMTTAACITAGVNAAAPTWCLGGTATTGTLDGHLNSPQGLVVYNNILYVADQGNQRVQSFATSNGAPGGWVGNVNVAPSATGQIATCSPLPSNGQATPGWCLSTGTGTAQVANRNNLSTNPVEVVAPSEGWNNPIPLTTDGVYLYVGDASNSRVVRILLSSGAFSGWIGQSPTRSLAGNTVSPALGAGNYTSNWTTGGISNSVASTFGFGVIRGITNDGTFIYVSDDYSKVSRVNLSNGQGFLWLGRTTTSPTGGYTGCSSTPVSGVTPGWCIGGAGNRAGNTNNAFYNPYGMAVGNSQLYIADSNNFRVQYVNTQGAFVGWIGANAISAPTWTRTLSSSVTPARWGIDDYSVADIGNNFNGIAINANGVMLTTDYAMNRLKKWVAQTGALVGYIGQIGTFAPTGPSDCVGFTSGMTPDWCTGGGRTTSGSGIQAYNNPLAIAADTTYAYVANLSNNRIDRVRISDSLYMGWLGNVNATPTDGASNSCLTAPAGSASPGWCIGGTAQTGSANGMFNNPRAMYYDTGGSLLYVIDATARIMRVDVSAGAFTGIIGSVASGATGCTITSSIAAGWCTAGTGNNATNGYGGINVGSAIATNSTYIYVADSSAARLDRFNKSSGAPAGFIANLSAATNTNVTVATGGPCASLSGFPKATPGFCFGTALGASPSSTTGAGDNMFNSPRGVWADDIYVYVADTNNNRIIRIDANTGTNMGWKGLIGSTSGMTDATCIAAGVGGITPKWCTGGTAAAGKLLGEFDFPTGLSGDANYIYVMDSHNNRTITLPR